MYSVRFVQVLVVSAIFVMPMLSVADVYWAQPQKIMQDSFDGSLIRVAPQVYLSGQPTASDLQVAADLGIERIINIRSHAELERQREAGRDEANEVKDLAMEYDHISTGSDDGFHPEHVAQLSVLLQQAADSGQRVLLHCGSGRRAAHIWVAWLIREQGLTYEAASRVARQLSFWAMPLEGFLQQELGFEPLADDPQSQELEHE